MAENTNPTGGIPDPEEGREGSEDTSVALIARAEAALAEQAGSLTVYVPRWRRFIRALHSLGALTLTGRDWVSLGDDGLVHFRPLTVQQFDRLASLLQDRADGIVPPVPTPGQGQIAFDFFPALPALPNGAGIDSPHAGVCR